LVVGLVFVLWAALAHFASVFVLEVREIDAAT